MVSRNFERIREGTVNISRLILVDGIVLINNLGEWGIASNGSQPGY
jgi:hypothetical protein